MEPEPYHKQNSSLIDFSNYQTQNDEDAHVTDTLIDYDEANNFYQGLDTSLSLINQYV